MISFLFHLPPIGDVGLISSSLPSFLPNIVENEIHLIFVNKKLFSLPSRCIYLFVITIIISLADSFSNRKCQHILQDQVSKRYVGVPGMNSICKALCREPGIYRITASLSTSFLFKV